MCAMQGMVLDHGLVPTYATPPMTSSPLAYVVLTAVTITGEDKENQPSREVIDLTADSKDKEVPDHVENLTYGSYLVTHPVTCSD